MRLVLAFLLLVQAGCAAYDPPHQFNNIWHSDNHYPDSWRTRR